jgi:lauroyl/myristoyl acyltransferase
MILRKSEKIMIQAAMDCAKAGVDFMYWVAYRAAKIIPKLPRGLRRAVAVVVGSVAWMLARRERRNVVSNIRHVLALPDQRSLAARIRAQLIGRRIFCNCINNYLELFALPALTTKEVLERIDMNGIEYVLEAISYGQGVILFSAHLGPFETMPFAMLRIFSQYSCEMVIPVEKVSDARMLNLMIELRRRSGVNFVPLDGVGAIMTMIEALQNNRLVLVTADRTVKGRSATMDFFGSAARLPRGPVDLSLRTGAPLVGAFGWRGPGGKLYCQFTRLTFALPEDQRKNPDILHTAIVRELEARIAGHLDEWVVFQPIWEHQVRDS